MGIKDGPPGRALALVKIQGCKRLRYVELDETMGLL